MSFPTLLLIVQLAVGAYALVEVIKAIVRRRVRWWLIGPIVLAILLPVMAIDGLWFQTDIVGRLAYDVGVEPDLVRPATIAVILGGTVLWMFDR